jgi:hypothetical protein
MDGGSADHARSSYLPKAPRKTKEFSRRDAENAGIKNNKSNKKINEWS